MDNAPTRGTQTVLDEDVACIPSAVDERACGVDNPTLKSLFSTLVPKFERGTKCGVERGSVVHISRTRSPEVFGVLCTGFVVV